MRDAADAVEFVRANGVVLASAKGPVPTLADAIAGETIRGSWWGHPEGKRIFALLRAVENDPDVLACSVVAGKRTFVHARLWPALVRCASRFPAEHLAWTREVHTASGKHERVDLAFPAWVPRDVADAARMLPESAALGALGGWVR